MTRMSKSNDSSEWLDALLDEVGADAIPDPAPDLMARILADAEAEMPPPGGRFRTVSFWRQALDAFGGWMPVGGLVAATAVGLAVGLGGLSGVGVDMDTVWATGSTDFGLETSSGLSAFGWDIEETGI